MTPEEKIQNIQQQIAAVELGSAECIKCPYCGLENRDGDVTCCRLFALAAKAIMERWDFEEAKENVERIAEMMDKQSNSLVTLN